jgi:hypothetical protein
LALHSTFPLVGESKDDALKRAKLSHAYSLAVVLLLALRRRLHHRAYRPVWPLSASTDEPGCTDAISLVAH